jgi:hypothetical protein
VPTTWPAASLYFGAIALFLAYAVTGRIVFLMAAVVAFAGQIVLRMRPRPASPALPGPQQPDQSRNATD